MIAGSLGYKYSKSITYFLATSFHNNPSEDTAPAAAAITTAIKEARNN